MTTCPHHWIIERAAGPASKGKCRMCGAEREFDNSVETWGGWTPRGQTRDKKEAAGNSCWIN